ncbi:hypothetical protein ZOD2009_01465 [Haladaptatus paucihalophilus DX253]|uniref:Uncharacterized protein n=1 Tax=Haladaptatus paucihalophilus DX253 TaxID=797209 RepID=E7QMX5_HALPU|nr:hypothetical protein ZOD2009_01465 [Haladaptatus paucihalophilus DX253]
MLIGGSWWVTDKERSARSRERTVEEESHRTGG